MGKINGMTKRQIERGTEDFTNRFIPKAEDIYGGDDFLIGGKPNESSTVGSILEAINEAAGEVSGRFSASA